MTRVWRVLGLSRIEGRGPIKSARTADGPKSECWPRVWTECLVDTEGTRNVHFLRGIDGVILNWQGQQSTCGEGLTMTRLSGDSEKNEQVSLCQQ